VGSDLVTLYDLDYETQSYYRIRVRTTDSTARTFE